MVSLFCQRKYPNFLARDDISEMDRGIPDAGQQFAIRGKCQRIAGAPVWEPALELAGRHVPEENTARPTGSQYLAVGGEGGGDEGNTFFVVFQPVDRFACRKVQKPDAIPAGR